MNGIPRGENLGFAQFLAKRQNVTLRESYGMCAAAVAIEHALAVEGVADGLQAFFATASRKLLGQALAQDSPAAAAAAFAESQAAGKVLEGLRGIVELVDREERHYLESLRSASEQNEEKEW